MQYLFAGAPDLLEEFKQFLPDTTGGAQTVPVRFDLSVDMLVLILSYHIFV